MNGGMKDGRTLATRIVMGPAIIAAVFFFLEKDHPFHDVWKPLLFYFVVAVPAFLLLDRFKAGAKGSP